MSLDNGVREHSGVGVEKHAVFAAKLLDTFPASVPLTHSELRNRRSTIDAIPEPVMEWLLEYRSDLIGGFDGAPIELRCDANRRTLQRWRETADRAGDAARLEHLREVDGDGVRQWLVIPETPTAMSVEVQGDPAALAAADTVVLAVAGRVDANEASPAAVRLAQQVGLIRAHREVSTSSSSPAATQDHPRELVGTRTESIAVVTITFPEIESLANTTEETATIVSVGAALQVGTDGATATAPGTAVVVGGIAEGAVPALRACERHAFDSFVLADWRGAVMVAPERVVPQPSRMQQFTQRIARGFGR